MLYYATIALDLALDRQREAADDARRQHVMRELQGGAPPRRIARPSLLRAVAASPLRIIGNVAATLSDAACGAATRIEGRTA